MELSRNTKALVLSRQDYREHDSLVLFYTLEYGRLSLVARGTKKPKSKLTGHLEPLSLADLMIVPGRGFDYAAGAIVREAFPSLKGDLNALYYAGQGIIFLKRFIEEAEPDKDIFWLIYNYFSLLAQYAGIKKDAEAGLQKLDGELILAFFILKFLAISGYQAQSEFCLSCRQLLKSGNNYFNLQNGGIICDACFEQQKLAGREPKPQVSREFLMISDNCVKLLRIIREKELTSVTKFRLDKKLIKELSALAKGFLDFRM